MTEKQKSVFAIILCLSVSLMAFQNCSKPYEEEDSSSSRLDTSALSITAYSVYGTNGAKIEIDKCEVNGSQSSPATATCDLNIPEAQLNLADLVFNVKVDAEKCSILYFTPYYYRKSISATYDPDPNTDGDTIDCSPNAPTDNKNCYSGAGINVVPQFPNYGGLYQSISLNNKDFNYTLKSPNSLAISHNRWIANDLPLVDRANSINVSEGYVPGTMTDYTFSCVNGYSEDIASITIYIHDVNGTDNSHQNHFQSWK